MNLPQNLDTNKCSKLFTCCNFQKLVNGKGNETGKKGQGEGKEGKEKDKERKKKGTESTQKGIGKNEGRHARAEDPT